MGILTYRQEGDYCKPDKEFFHQCLVKIDCDKLFYFYEDVCKEVLPYIKAFFLHKLLYPTYHLIITRKEFILARNVKSGWLKKTLF